MGNLVSYFAGHIVGKVSYSHVGPPGMLSSVHLPEPKLVSRHQDPPCQRNVNRRTDQAIT